MPPLTITTLALKGGVGKSTLVANLAGYFALEGANVLCIDLDGQASISRLFLGSEVVENLAASEAVNSVFLGDSLEHVHRTELDGISMLPATPSLARLEKTERVARDENSAVITELIGETGEEFDIVLIDTPPRLIVDTVWSALVASHFVVSPVQPEAFGAHSVGQVISFVSDVQQRSNPNLGFLGFVISMAEKNAGHRTYAEMLRSIHGDQVFETAIPKAAQFRDANNAGSTVRHLKPKTKAAEAVVAYGKEIESRIEKLLDRRKAA